MLVVENKNENNPLKLRFAAQISPEVSPLAMGLFPGLLAKNPNGNATEASLNVNGTAILIN